MNFIFAPLCNQRCGAGSILSGTGSDSGFWVVSRLRIRLRVKYFAGSGCGQNIPAPVPCIPKEIKQMKIGFSYKHFEFQNIFCTPCHSTRANVFISCLLVLFNLDLFRNQSRLSFDGSHFRLPRLRLRTKFWAGPTMVTTLGKIFRFRRIQL